jgi:hypothetical protein
MLMTYRSNAVAIRPVKTLLFLNTAKNIARKQNKNMDFPNTDDMPEQDRCNPSRRNALISQYRKKYSAKIK